MKNYIIVAIIIILIIVGVVWFKTKSPEVVVPADETTVTTEPTPIDNSDVVAPVVPADASGTGTPATQ